MYYNEHLRPTDISKGLNIDNGYITKIIKQDERYQTEKEQRKQFNKQKHKEQTIAYIKEIRHSQKEEYEILISLLKPKGFIFLFAQIQVL